MYSNLTNHTCFAPSLVKEVGMWKTCLFGLPFGLISCVLLLYLTLGSNPYVIVLKIKNATSQSNLSNFLILSDLSELLSIIVTIMYHNDELSSTMNWVNCLLKDSEPFILSEEIAKSFSTFLLLTLA